MKSLIVLMALLCPAHALAFQCKNVAGGGPSLVWVSRCIDIRVDRSAPELADESNFAAIQAAIEAWEKPRCTDLRLTVTTGADATGVSTIQAADPGDPLAEEALAITIESFDVQTGEVIEADTFIDFEDFDIGRVGPGCTRTYDLATVVLHETGHILGFDHSGEEDAVLSPRIGDCEVATQLEADDENAVCSVYPRGAPVNPCTPSPIGYDEVEASPFRTPCPCAKNVYCPGGATCDVPNKTCSLLLDPGGCGCRSSRSGKPLGGAGLGFFTLLIAVLWWRRRLQ